MQTSHVENLKFMLVWAAELFLLTSDLVRLLPSARTLLKNGNVEVRIEAGEFIAHVFELGRDYDELFDEQVI